MKAFDTTVDCTKHIKQMKEDGIIAVGRYYTHKHDSWKIMKRAEAVALSKAKIGIFAVYQARQNQDDDFDREKGLYAGKEALNYAKHVIGQPYGSAIYFAVDYDAQNIDDNILPYFKAVNEVFKKASNPYKIGVYGSGDVCTKLKDAGLVQYTWLTQSMGFSGSREYAKSGEWNILQELPDNYDGMEIDPDKINLSIGFGAFILKV